MRQSLPNSPKISFVTVARNDNYAGNFLHRLQVFIDVLLTLSEKHSLNIELVIVEWNPPQDKPRLKDALKWPKVFRHSQVRIIGVPNEVHRELPNSDRFPLFEWVGKNVGIRRAKGEYILVTNADIIFNEELIEFLARKELLPDFFYRVDRFDVKNLVPLNVSIGELFRYCKRNILKHLSFFGDFTPGLSIKNIIEAIKGFLGYLKEKVLLFPFPLPRTSAAGDFFLTHRDNWYNFRGFPELKVQLYVDGCVCYMALASGLREFFLGDPIRIYHQDHDHKESWENRPPLPYKIYKENCRQMIKEHRPMIFNDDKWGLLEKDLPETIIN